MYGCFHSVWLLKQKYCRNCCCSETNLLRNKVNGQPLKKNAGLAHSHVPELSCTRRVGSLWFPLPINHGKNSTPLLSTFTVLIYSPSSTNDTLPSLQIPFEAGSWKLLSLFVLPCLSCPWVNLKGKGTNSTWAVQPEQISSRGGGAVLPIWDLLLCSPVFVMPTFGPGALLIGDGLTECKSPTVCSPASADSDLPGNKSSPANGRKAGALLLWRDYWQRPNTTFLLGLESGSSSFPLLLS